MNNIKRVCVYCASSPKIDKKYFEATEILAGLLVDSGIEVVFGGGSAGLMGKLADVVLEKGGKIKGIMPYFMKDVEWSHKGVSDFEYTQTMAERKEKFLIDIQGLIALPGGSGTLEELLEALTLKRLGKFNYPIVILNVDGYYNPLKEMLEKTVTENFMNKKHLEMWEFVDAPELVIPALINAKPWDKGAINFAQNR